MWDFLMFMVGVVMVGVVVVVFWPLIAALFWIVLGSFLSGGLFVIIIIAILAMWMA